MVVLSGNPGPFEKGNRRARAPGVFRGLRGDRTRTRRQTFRVREHRRHHAVAHDSDYGRRLVERADRARLPGFADPPTVRGPVIPQVRPRAGRMFEQPLSVRGPSVSSPLFRRRGVPQSFERSLRVSGNRVGPDRRRAPGDPARSARGRAGLPVVARAGGEEARRERAEPQGNHSHLRQGECAAWRTDRRGIPGGPG